MIKQIIGGSIALMLFVVILWGCYFVVKTISYKLFYEDMVKQTITEMVKQESLR